MRQSSRAIAAFRAVLASVSFAALMSVTAGMAAGATGAHLGSIKSTDTWQVGTVGPANASYCAMVNKYEKDTVLAFARDPDGFGSLALNLASKVFSAGKDYKVTLTPNGAAAATFTANASSERSIVVQIGQNQQFFDSLSGASSMKLSTTNVDATFAMDKFGDGYKNLLDCSATLKSSAPTTMVKNAEKSSQTAIDQEAAAISSGAKQKVASADSAPDNALDSMEAQIDKDSKTSTAASDNAQKIEDQKKEIAAKLEAARKDEADLQTQKQGTERKLLASMGSGSTVTAKAATGSEAQQLEQRQMAAITQEHGVSAPVPEKPETLAAASKVAAAAAVASAAADQKAQADKLAAQKAADDKAAADKTAAIAKAAQARAAKDQAEADKIAQERAAQDKLAAAKAAQDQADKEKAAADQLAQQKLAADRAAQDKIAQEKAAQDKLAAATAAAQAKAAQDKLAAQAKAAQDKLAAQEKAAQDTLAAQQKEADRIAQAKFAAQKGADSKVQELEAERDSLKHQLDQAIAFNAMTTPDAKAEAAKQAALEKKLAQSEQARKDMDTRLADLDQKNKQAEAALKDKQQAVNVNDSKAVADAQAQMAALKAQNNVALEQMKKDLADKNSQYDDLKKQLDAKKAQPVAAAAAPGPSVADLQKQLDEKTAQYETLKKDSEAKKAQEGAASTAAAATADADLQAKYKKTADDLAQKQTTIAQLQEQMKQIDAARAAEADRAAKAQADLSETRVQMEQLKKSGSGNVLASSIAPVPVPVPVAAMAPVRPSAAQNEMAVPAVPAVPVAAEPVPAETQEQNNKAEAFLDRIMSYHTHGAKPLPVTAESKGPWTASGLKAAAPAVVTAKAAPVAQTPAVPAAPAPVAAAASPADASFMNMLSKTETAAPPPAAAKVSAPSSASAVAAAAIAAPVALMQGSASGSGIISKPVPMDEAKAPASPPVITEAISKPPAFEAAAVTPAPVPPPAPAPVVSSAPVPPAATPAPASSVAFAAPAKAQDVKTSVPSETASKAASTPPAPPAFTGGPVTLSALLQQAGTEQPRFMPLDEAPGEVVRQWKVGKVDGMYEETPSGGNFDAAVQNYIDRYREDCPGHLSVDVGNTKRTKAGMLASGNISCSIPTNNYSTSMIFLQDKESFNTILHTGHAADAATVRSIGDHLTQTLASADNFVVPEPPKTPLAPAPAAVRTEPAPAPVAVVMPTPAAVPTPAPTAVAPLRFKLKDAPAEPKQQVDQYGTVIIE